MPQCFAEQGSSGGSVALGAGGASTAGVLLLMVGGAARAAEDDLSQGPDLLTSVLFSLTAVALGVLTVGVNVLTPNPPLVRFTYVQQMLLLEKAAAWIGCLCTRHHQSCMLCKLLHISVACDIGCRSCTCQRHPFWIRGLRMRQEKSMTRLQRQGESLAAHSHEAAIAAARSSGAPSFCCHSCCCLKTPQAP